MRKIVFVPKFQDFIVGVIKDFICGMSLHMTIAIGDVPPSKMPPLDGLRDEFSPGWPAFHGGRGIDAVSRFDTVIVEALVTREVRPAINLRRVRYCGCQGTITDGNHLTGFEHFALSGRRRWYPCPHKTAVSQAQ